MRLDINADCRPDIVASMLDMGDIGTFEGVYSSHCLEHVYPHEVPVALGEFLRVLRPGGAAVVIVPDLGDVRPTEDVVYESPAGPVTGLDMFYGYRPVLAAEPFMAHHTGFVAETLATAMESAGFVRVQALRIAYFNLMGIGYKS